MKTTGWKTVVASAALCALAACTMPDDSDSEALDVGVAVPSQESMDAAAERTIDEENFDEEYERLAAELGIDP